MVFEYVEGVEEALKEYTDVTIIDERKLYENKHRK